MSITGPIVNYFYSPVVRPAVERPLSLLANFVREQFRINGGGVLFDTAFDITRSSSKYVYGTGAQTGQLIEVPAGQPAYQHDPVTGAPLGLSVEGSATNLFTESEQFDLWVNPYGVGSVVSDAETSPDGSVTADELISANGAFSGREKSVAVTNGQDYNFSVFLKDNGINLVQLFSRDVINGSLAEFDLQNETTTDAGGFGSKIEKLGNGWFRCSVSYTSTLTGSNRHRVVLPASVSDGVRSVYAWGAQLEQGTTPTSYIPTTTSTLTRAADIVTSDAATFGDWFNASEGTFVVEFDNTGGGAVIGIGDGTFNNTLVVGGNGNFLRATGTGFAKPVSVGAVFKGEGKAAFVMQEDNYRLSVNGGAVESDNSASLPPNVNLLEVGASYGTNYTNGTIKQITFIPEVLSDAELQQRSAL